MQAQVKLGRVYGIELGLHYSWLIIAVLIVFSLAARFHYINQYWSEQVIWGTAIVTSLLFFVTLFAHELSHAIVAKSRKLPVRGITLFALGGVTQIEKEATDAKTEFWMGIAGPITSIVIGIVLLWIAEGVGWIQRTNPETPGLAILVWLGYINIVLGLFNMIPGFPLDGGRVLRAIVWWITGNANKSTRIAARVGQFIAVLFILYGIFRFFTGAGFGGLWLAFIGWFLWQAAGASFAQLQVTGLLKDLHVGDLMSRDCASIDGRTTLQHFVDEQLLRTGRRCFIITENGHMAGLVTPHEVRAVERSLWPATELRQIMLPLDKIRSVAPETPVMQAMEMMAREDVNQLPVVSDHHLQGMLSRASILQILHARAELKRAA